MILNNQELKKEGYLLYSINQFSDSSGINGRKKLMKLMFFLEHLDLDRDDLVPDRLYSKNEFMVYNYGPFSFDVMNSVESLKDSESVYEKTRSKPYTIGLTESGKEESRKIGEKIPDGMKRRVKRVKEKFGSKPGWKLEELSLEYLGIDEENKTFLKGIPVRTIISEKYD